MCWIEKTFWFLLHRGVILPWLLPTLESQSIQRSIWTRALWCVRRVTDEVFLLQSLMRWSGWGSPSLPATLRSASSPASCCSSEQPVWVRLWSTRWRPLWRKLSTLPHGLTYRCSVFNCQSIHCSFTVKIFVAAVPHSHSGRFSRFCRAACRWRTLGCWSTRPWGTLTCSPLPGCWEALLSSARNSSAAASLYLMKPCSRKLRR